MCLIMKKPPQGLCIILDILLITACGPITPVSMSTPAPVKTKSPTLTQVLDTQLYLSEVLDIIQKQAYNSKKVEQENQKAIETTLTNRSLQNFQVVDAE